MNFSINYFGKEIELLTFQNVINFFVDEKEESDKCEFKSFSIQHGDFNKDLEGVIRGICALLNSDGGILIWGAPEGVVLSGRKEKTYKGNLCYVNELKEKDWLINKISDNINPLPVGIKVKPLIDERKYLYIFEVQPSIYKPHQYRNIYYARLDGQTKPAPHYLIEALFRRISFPNIEGYIKLNKIDLVGNEYHLDLSIFIFNSTPLQNEHNVSFKLMCLQGIFASSKDISEYTYKHYARQGHELIFNDFTKVLHYGAPYLHEDKLIFNSQQLLTKFNNQVELFLIFGGKKSPLKSSEYKLDFNKIDLNKQDNSNYLITSKEENILIADKQNQTELPSKEYLKKLLGR